MTRKRKTQSTKRNEEIKELLKDMTLKADPDVVLMDPNILDTLLTANSSEYLRTIAEDRRLQNEQQQQIQQLLSIARQKTTGRMRECLMLLLSGCDSYSEIGRRLGLSKDTVRRAIEKGTAVLKAHIGDTEASGGDRQSTKSSLPFDTALFPLDTCEERRAFQEFINSNRVEHLAFSSGKFREALVIFQKPRSRPRKNGYTGILNSSRQTEFEARCRRTA